VIKNGYDSGFIFIMFWNNWMETKLTKLFIFRNMGKDCHTIKCSKTLNTPYQKSTVTYFIQVQMYANSCFVFENIFVW